MAAREEFMIQLVWSAKIFGCRVKRKLQQFLTLRKEEIKAVFVQNPSHQEILPCLWCRSALGHWHWCQHGQTAAISTGSVVGKRQRTRFHIINNSASFPTAQHSSHLNTGGLGQELPGKREQHRTGERMIGYSCEDCHPHQHWLQP